MQTKKANKWLSLSLVVLALAVVVLAGALWSPVAAQGVPQIPPPKPGSDPTDISTMLNNLSVAARYYYSQYVRNIEGQILYYLKVLAGALAIPLACQAFLKLLRQHGGGSTDMFWWFGRVAVSFVLISSATYIVAETALYGRILAFGGMDQRSYLNSLVVEQQRLLNDNLERFQVNSTCMTVDGKVIWLNPDPGNSQTLLAVLEPRETSLKNLAEGKIDTSNWSLPLGLKLVQVTRGLLELVDFSLLYLSMVLYLAFRLMAPVAACAYIDRQFAERFSKPIAWGGFVFLVVQPFIAQVFRLLAYSLGNTALYAVIPAKPLYTFNPRSMLAVGNHPDPTLSLYFLAASMLVCTGLLLLSYWIAYRFSKGEVLESITSTVQGWMLSGAATGVATVSGEAAAGLQHQAQLAQLQGTAEAGSVEAKANRAADQETTRANWMHQDTATHAHAANQRSAIGGQLQGELMQARSDLLAQIGEPGNLGRVGSIEAQRGKENRHVGANRDYGVEREENDGAQDRARQGAYRQQQNHETMNRAVSQAGTALMAGGAGKGAVATGAGGTGGTEAVTGESYQRGGQRGPGFVQRGGLPGLSELETLAEPFFGADISPASQAYQRVRHISTEHETQQIQAVNKQGEALKGANDTYAQEMEGVAHMQYEGRTAAARARAGGAMAGVNREEAMMIEANRANYQAQVTALGLRHDAREQAIAIQRHAGEEAAGLQRDAARMTLLGQQLAKQIESMNFKW